MESVICEEMIGKVCLDCKTSKTPLWRSGPAGPKSLCNACGIRFRKKKGISGSDKKKPLQSPSPSPSSSTTDDINNTLTCRKREIGEDVSFRNSDLRVRVVAMGREAAAIQRPRSPMKKVKRRIENDLLRNKYKFGEVEEAAYLLMCLSCG